MNLRNIVVPFAASAGILLSASDACSGALDNVTPGTWYEFPDSHLESVAPSPSPNGSLEAVMFAWSGGIYDSDRDQLIVWGGGHTDYAGNEVYAFGPLTGDPTWKRLTEPSNPPADNTAHGSDGRPVSRHTYNLLAYMPAPHNKMASCAIGSQYSNGFSGTALDFFDLSVDPAVTEPWSRGTPPSTRYGLEAFCVYNPITDSLWFHDNGSNQAHLQEYDPATDSWESYAFVYPHNDATAAIAVPHNLLVSVGQGIVRVWDLDQPSNDSFTVSTTGPQDAENGKAPGFVYDPINGRFVAWSGGESLYSLSIPDDFRNDVWTWTSIDIDASNTVTPTRVAGLKILGYETGTYGRFRYVPSLHGVVLVNATDENVYFFKLRGSAGSPVPSVSLAANPTSVPVQGTTNLNWSSTNASRCDASGDWDGSKALSGSESVGPLSERSTFTLRCVSASGVAATDSTTVTIQGSSEPAINEFTANPATVHAGTFSTLEWSTSNVDECSASGAWSGVKALQGNESVGPIDQQSQFFLDCNGAGGAVSSSVTVRLHDVDALPVINFAADPTSVQQGGASTLTWAVSDATECSASGAWSGARPTSGNERVGPLSSTSEFALSCSGVGGEATRTVTVAVSSSASGDGDDGAGGGGSTGLIALLLLFCAVLMSRCRDMAGRGSTAGLILLATSFMADDALAAHVVDVTVQSQSSSSQADVPVTFGHVFSPGDVPSAFSLVARLPGGSILPLQVDEKATHSDGSLRHAILTTRVPNLGGNASQIIILETGTPLGGEALSKADLLATGFDVQVSLNSNGTDYFASARDALAAATTWLEGPLVSGWIGGGPVTTSMGAEHPHLAVYFHVRAYSDDPAQLARVDVVFENNWSFVPGPKNQTYSVTISVPGKPDYQNSLTHYSRSRWHRRVWWGEQPAAYVKHDTEYLQSTQAIPNYEEVQPSESFLNSVRQSTEPMSNGDQSANMDNTGYQPAIGPLPLWDSIYAVSGDVRAFNYMLANADGGGAYSTHLRDELTGLPISIDDYPQTSVADPRGSSPQLPEPSSTSPYWHGGGSDHQPSIGFLPYLVTGDYYYLEEMQFWSAYNLIWTNSDYRNGSDGWWYVGSLRGQAWAYRSLAQAAYATPDDHPFKAYLLDKLSSNIQRDIELYVSPGGQHKNNLGAMYMAEGNEEYRFYDYFMSWAAQYLVDLGFTDAIPFRDYKLQFPIGLMGIESDEYCFQSAPNYTWRVGPEGTSTFYSDWRTVYEHNVSAEVAGLECGSEAMANALGVSLNEMIGGQGESATYWFANLQPAIAAAYDSGLPGGEEAWERSLLSGKHPDYSDTPIWGIQPHSISEPRVKVSLSANPSVVQPGESTTLSWTTSNADTCNASGGWAGRKATSGSETIGPLSSNTSFELTCSSNALGSSASSVTMVTIGSGPAPTVSVTAEPQNIESGGSSTISWSSNDATSCSASGDWTGSQPTSGNRAFNNLTVTQTYTLTCSGDGGSASDTVQVVVAASSGIPPADGDGGTESGGGSTGIYFILLALIGASWSGRRSGWQ